MVSYLLLFVYEGGLRGRKLDLIIFPADGAQVTLQILVPRIFFANCKCFGFIYNLVHEITDVSTTILFKLVYFDFPKALWIL